MADEEDPVVEGLRQTCLLQNVGTSSLKSLSMKMKRVDFKAGEQVGPAQGEPQDAMFVVTSGRVKRVHEGFRKTRVQTVDEGPLGMGDADSFRVSWELDEDGGALISVEGPDSDGLLSSTSRALFSNGVKILSAHATCPEDGRRASTLFRVEREDGSIGKKQAAMLATAVREAAHHTRLGSLRESGRVNSFGTLHCVGKQPAFATTTADTDGVAWRLSTEHVEEFVKKQPVDVTTGLCAEIFRMSESYSVTPLFDQQPQRVNAAAVSVAAAFESYYRSMLNSVLNSSLSGTSGATLFPNMHVQIPTRVAYINGFKFLRQMLADEERLAEHKWVPALLPGVMMTPISSVLEACNAGHANPEPLWRRATRGTTPRCAREVLFGLGLNNLADYFEEAVPQSLATTKLVRNGFGSIAAGVVAGYFSHVPHNLSTLKMLEPHKSYRQHWASLVDIARATRLPPNLPNTSATILANVLCLIVPAGLAIRTTQIVGSFCLLNGISHVLG